MNSKSLSIQPQFQHYSDLEKSFNQSSHLHRETSRNLIRSAQPLFNRKPSSGRPVNKILQSITERIETDVDSLIEISKNKNEGSLQVYEKRIQELYSFLIQKYKEAIYLVKDSAKLTSEEVESYIKKFEEKIHSEVNYTNGKDEIVSLNISKEINQIRIIEHILLHDLVGFFEASRPIIFTKYFPLVVPNTMYVKKGEMFKAEIFLGNYLVDPLHDYSLKINNKKFEFDNNKLAYQEKASDKIGKKELILNLKFKNSDTGEIQNSNSSFIYFVIE